MLYQLLHPLTNIFYRVFYKIDLKGHKNIPLNTPIVLAPNHSNGFIDPVIIAMSLKPKVRFFARGDVFKGRFAKWALNDMNISPMYRIQEGYAELKKNDKTFEECRQLLTDNKILLLFPEAICILEKRLRPLKKGLARIVFQTEETLDFKKDILVIPVGINYSDAKRFRSKVFIDFGTPISVKEYEAQYKQDKVRTINDFTKVLEQKMAEHLVIINNPENDELVEAIEEIYLNTWIENKKQNFNDLNLQYEASKEIAKLVNQLESLNSDVLFSLKEKTTSYINKLKANQLRDHLLRPENINKMNGANFLLEYLIIYFGMPFYGLALICNYPPYYFAKKISYQKAKHVEFIASLYANVAMIFWILFFILQLLTIAIFFHNWIMLFISMLLIPSLGYFALQFYPLMKKIVGRWRLLRMVRKNRDEVVGMVNERAAIIEQIELAIKITSNT